MIEEEREPDREHLQLFSSIKSSLESSIEITAVPEIENAQQTDA